MNQENSAPSPFGVGIITIITVLLVLTLSIFAALTLTSAKADLALSQINADTVQAYYAADSEAAALYAAFVSGTEPELQREIPLQNDQVLSLHLLREADGSVTILAWDVTPVQPDDGEIDDAPDLWDGGDLS